MMAGEGFQIIDFEVNELICVFDSLLPVSIAECVSDISGNVCGVWETVIFAGLITVIGHFCLKIWFYRIIRAILSSYQDGDEDSINYPQEERDKLRKRDLDKFLEF